MTPGGRAQLQVGGRAFRSCAGWRWRRRVARRLKTRSTGPRRMAHTASALGSPTGTLRLSAAQSSWASTARFALAAAGRRPTAHTGANAARKTDPSARRRRSVVGGGGVDVGRPASPCGRRGELVASMRAAAGVSSARSARRAGGTAARQSLALHQRAAGSGWRTPRSGTRPGRDEGGDGVTKSAVVLVTISWQQGAKGGRRVDGCSRGVHPHVGAGAGRSAKAATRGAQPCGGRAAFTAPGSQTFGCGGAGVGRVQQAAPGAGRAAAPPGHHGDLR